MSHQSISREPCVLLVAGVCWVASSFTARAQNDGPRRECDETNGGIALPDGSCASVYADNLGHTRHLAVAASGAVYVNSWSSQYTEMKNAPGRFVLALRDADGDGYAELVASDSAPCIAKASPAGARESPSIAMHCRSRTTENHRT